MDKFLRDIIIMIIILTICLSVYTAFHILHNPSNIKHEFDFHTYKLGLIKGCDVGCIQYDLQVHNTTWNNTAYTVLTSNAYKQCSHFCTDTWRDR